MKTGFFQLAKSIVVMAMLGVCAVAFGEQDVEVEPKAVGYTVGGTVTGLVYENSVVLQNRGSNDLTVDANGSFVFTNQLPDGALYDVTILNQPASPDQICSVMNGTGTIDGANVIDILIDCDEPPLNPYCLGGVGDKNVLVIDYNYDSGTVVDCIAENSIEMINTSVIKDTTLNLISPIVSLNEWVNIELGSRLNVLTPVPIPLRLNDTGIVYCGDDDINGWICPVATHPGQDGDYGRDATHNDDSDGHAGFSFTKLDADGQPLLADATSWSCVKDNVTGLIWQVRTDDGGLHDKDDSYSWYNTNPETNGGDAGSPDNGDGFCFGYDSGDPTSYCNTQAYTARVNKVGLCGAKDWRMPTRSELRNIVSLDRVNPSIDTDYFPNTNPSGYLDLSAPYFSSTTDASFSGIAVSTIFERGHSDSIDKEMSILVRLVRDGR